MEVLFTKSFLKGLENIQDKKLATKIESIISGVKSCTQLSELENLKKLTGFKNSYRIRVGDYRIGIIYEIRTVTFVAFGHRKDIYKFFP
ncbi:MAG: type II toxin-antitoxin system RelE/ParE family toxin [Bacteroidota bacterium]|nr:type II toxin-antitoxin system RelE/ParE family toxin [Bacteroidota bacterium]